MIAPLAMHRECSLISCRPSSITRPAGSAVRRPPRQLATLTRAFGEGSSYVGLATSFPQPQALSGLTSTALGSPPGLVLAGALAGTAYALKGFRHIEPPLLSGFAGGAALATTLPSQVAHLPESAAIVAAAFACGRVVVGPILRARLGAEVGGEQARLVTMGLGAVGLVAAAAGHSMGLA